MREKCKSKMMDNLYASLKRPDAAIATGFFKNEN